MDREEGDGWMDGEEIRRWMHTNIYIYIYIYIYKYIYIYGIKEE